MIAQASQDWLAVDETTDTPPERRVRYVFDEGHHLFDAADSGFAALVSGTEMAELRRWIRGAEGRARSRMRGLEERLKDLVADDEVAQSALDEAVAAAGALAGEGWMAQRRGRADRADRAKLFLAAAYQHVRARSEDRDAFYSLEADTAAAGRRHDRGGARAGARAEAHRRAAGAAREIACASRSTTKPTELETYTRARLEAAARGLERRAKLILPAWIAMLDALETGERGRNSSTGSRSSARTAAISMWGCGGTGSIPPFRWRPKCWRRRMAR